MKQRYLLKISILQILQHLESSLVILFALTVSVVALLHTARQMLYSSDFLLKADEYRRTYNLNIWNRDVEQSRSLIDTLLFTDTYEVESIDDVYVFEEDQYTSGYSLTSGIYLQGNGRYRQSVALLYGRMFTEEEVEDGAPVIILKEYDASVLDKDVGDSVLFGGESYEIIGINDNLCSYIPYKSVLKNMNLSLDPNTVCFSKALSDNEKAQFCEYIESMGGSPQSLYEFYKSGFIRSEMMYMVLMLLLAVCALSIIAQLFLYMMESRKYEMQVYETLGVTRGFKLLVFYVPILILTVLAAAAGDILYYLSEPLQKKLGFEEQLGIAGSILVNVFVIIIMIITSIPIYRKMERE